MDGHVTTSESTSIRDRTHTRIPALQFCARIYSSVVSGSCCGGALLQNVQRPGCCSFKGFARRYLWLPVPWRAHEPFLHEAGDQHTVDRPDLKQAATTTQPASQ